MPTRSRHRPPWARSQGRDVHSAGAEEPVIEPLNIYIALAFDIGYCRRMLRGIADYVRTRTTWRIMAARLGDMHARHLEEETRHGVIAMLGPGEALDWITQRGIPAVNVSARHTGLPVPQVISDNVAVGRAAAEHLIERGFEHFGYFGLDMGYSHDRQRGFVEALHEAGFECDVYQRPPQRDRRGGGYYQIVLPSRWIEKLPRPIGILGCDDHQAGHVIDAALHAGLRVPRDVAVVGVDNDDVACELATVSLSSVDTIGERIGYEAAALLNAMLHGEPAPEEAVRIPPRGVVTRESSMSHAYDDPLIVTAMRFIERHACEGANVNDLVAELGVARRTLETRFKRAVGRTPLAEFHRVRFERARRLLAETEHPVKDVARAAGFKDARRFSRMFREEVGQPPSEYRAVHRGM